MKTTISKLVLALSLGALVFARTAAAISTVELTNGILAYNAFNTTSPFVNTLTVSFSGGVYTIDDPAEATIMLGTSATALGCAIFDSNTVTCPAASITSFDVRTNAGQDRIDLTNVPVPAAIDGGFEPDTIVGGDGDDTIVWSPGGSSDVIDGGAGTDTLRFFGSNIGEVITISAAGSGFRVTRNIAAIDLRADGIELLDLVTLGGLDDVSTTPLRNTTQQLKGGTDADLDTLRIDADARCLTREGDLFETPGFGPILIAHFGNIVVSDLFCRPNPCEGAVATMGCTVNGVPNQSCQGSDGNDVITGTIASDVILGGGGNDKIRGGAGDDLLCGEGGYDALSGGRDNDTVVGDVGADSLKGDSGNDIVIGGDDDDRLIGGSGGDDVDGGFGNDKLVAGSGDDTLRGGDGVDQLKGGGGAGDGCTDTDQIGPFSGCELP